MPKHDPSPDAQALAAEWWRVDEMGDDFVRLRFNRVLRANKPWFCTYQTFGSLAISHQADTPAAAIIAAHEAWQKEQGK